MLLCSSYEFILFLATEGENGSFFAAQKFLFGPSPVTFGAVFELTVSNNIRQLAETV